MIKVFYCEYTGEQYFTKMWWCDTCNNVGKRVIVSRGSEADFDKIPWENEHPVPCENCSGSASFSCRGGIKIYRRIDTGEEVIELRKLPGACYEDPDGAWDSKARCKRFGPDGRALNLTLPNGRTWYIDSRASNCTLPHDNEHRCWVRSGKVEEGTLHVDKNGLTCQAGAGSIIAGDFHGFCHAGFITEC
jgi:hypothetical protein